MSFPGHSSEKCLAPAFPLWFGGDAAVAQPNAASPPVRRYGHPRVLSIITPRIVPTIVPGGMASMTMADRQSLLCLLTRSTNTIPARTIPATVQPITRHASCGDGGSDGAGSRNQSERRKDPPAGRAIHDEGDYPGTPPTMAPTRAGRPRPPWPDLAAGTAKSGLMCGLGCSAPPGGSELRSSASMSLAVLAYRSGFLLNRTSSSRAPAADQDRPIRSAAG